MVPKTLWFEKRETSTAHPHYDFGHLILLTITYDRAGFGYESLRYYVQKDYVFSYTSCMSTPLDTADRLSTPRGEQYQTSLNILRWMYNTKKRSEWNSSALSPTRKQKCPSGGRGTERTVWSKPASWLDTEQTVQHATLHNDVTRSALSRAHVPPTKVIRRLSE